MGNQKNIVSEGRSAKNPTNNQDKEFILKFVKRDAAPNQFSSIISNCRNTLMKSINAYDPSLLAGKGHLSLYDLKKIVDANHIHIKRNIKKAEISQDDVDHLKREFDIFDDKKARDKYRAYRSKYIKYLTDAGLEMQELATKSLDELKSMMDDRGIDFHKAEYEKKWKIYESDVVKGVNEFLDSGLIHVDGIPLAEGTCKAKAVGGGY